VWSGCNNQSMHYFELTPDNTLGLWTVDARGQPVDLFVLDGSGDARAYVGKGGPYWCGNCRERFQTWEEAADHFNKPDDDEAAWPWSNH
jgi:hypothetical protein